VRQGRSEAEAQDRKRNLGNRDPEDGHAFVLVGRRLVLLVVAGQAGVDGRGVADGRAFGGRGRRRGEGGEGVGGFVEGQVLKPMF